MKFSFENQTLDAGLRELRRDGKLIPVEPQVFDLLLYVMKARDQVVSKDDLIAHVWGGRIVSDSTLASRITAARKAIGDSGEEQRLIRTIARRGIRFVAAITESASDQQTPPAAAPTVAPAALRQEVQFCTAPDSVQIAYAAVGNGPPLMKTGHWLTHLEYDWESPVWSPFLQRIAAEHRLIRYDKRGNGLSDWDVADLSFESFISDLESVVAAAAPERFPLIGMSQGCAISIAYAIRHPERLTHLILYGGFARGVRRRGNPEMVTQSDALLTLMQHGWGQENPAFRQIFTTRFVPGGSAEQIQWFNELQRRTTSPENAVRIRKAVDEIDISDLLSQVRVPTLVMHCRDDAAVPFEEGRRLAAGIPGAHFVALDGRNHVVLEGDPGWERMFEEVKAFLKP